MEPIYDHHYYNPDLNPKKRYRARQRERFMCIECAQPTVPGYVRCQRHIVLRRAYRVGESARATARKHRLRAEAMWLLMLAARVRRGQPDVI
jgi:hypothetical protein